MEKVFNIADLFEKIAAKVPERDAVICGGRRTYGDLDKRANQLAHFLQEKGIGQDDHVGLYL